MDATLEKEKLSYFGVLVNPKIQRMKMTMDAFKVYASLCEFVETGFGDDDLPMYCCRASYKRIIEHALRPTYPEASESHLKNKTIDAVKELCDLQIIEKNMIKDVNGNQANVYRLRPDSDWCIDAKPTTKERYKFNVRGRKNRNLTPVSSNPDSNTTISTQEIIMQSKKLSKLIIKGFDDIEEVPDVFVFNEDIPTPPVFDYTGLTEDSDEYLEILQQEVEYNQRKFKAQAKWAKAYQKVKQARENKNRIEKSPFNPRNFIPNIDEIYANAPSEGGSLLNKPGVVYSINQVDEKFNTGSESDEVKPGNVYDSSVSGIDNVSSQNLTISKGNGCNPYIESNTVNGNENSSNSLCYNSSSFINTNNKINKEEDYYQKVEILSSPEKKKYYFDLECQILLIEMYGWHKPKNWFSIEKGIPAYQKRQLNEILREENFNGNAGELLKRLESGLKYAKQDEYWNDNQGGLHSLLYHSNFEIWAGMYEHQQSKAIETQIETANEISISTFDCKLYHRDFEDFLNQNKKYNELNSTEDEFKGLTPEDLTELRERKQRKQEIRNLIENVKQVIFEKEEAQRPKLPNPELEYENSIKNNKTFSGKMFDEKGNFTPEFLNFSQQNLIQSEDEYYDF